MRTALGDAARRAWPNCVYAAAAPDAIVDLDGNSVGHVSWNVQYESALYQNYLQALSPVNAVVESDAARRCVDFVNLGSLAHVHMLMGRGTSAVVRRDASPTLYVLKGVDFGGFLASHDDFMHDRDVFYHTIKTLYSMPTHPNIQPPPQIFVVAGNANEQGQAHLCGTLYPFMTRGTLDDQVTTCKVNETRIRPQDKALWCLQLASALAHTHYKAHTYHMDIKPSNILMDDEGNVLLIDWEQSGAPPFTLAPEANGDWDVDDIRAHPGAPLTLAYKKYNGPTRVNLPRGRPVWNVFPEWSRRWPRACEAAEAFSLGRKMWMLLQEVAQEDIQDLDPQDITVYWSGEADDIPDTWKDIVMRCMEQDPNKRVAFTDLRQFWEQQQDVAKSGNKG